MVVVIFGFLAAGSSTVDFAAQSTVCSWMAPGVNGSAAVGVSGCLLLHCDLEEEQMGGFFPLGAAGVASPFISDFCQSGTWEAALLGRSFFASGCFE